MVAPHPHLRPHPRGSRARRRRVVDEVHTDDALRVHAALQKMKVPLHDALDDHRREKDVNEYADERKNDQQRERDGEQHSRALPAAALASAALAGARRLLEASEEAEEGSLQPDAAPFVAMALEDQRSTRITELKSLAFIADALVQQGEPEASRLELLDLTESEWTGDEEPLAQGILDLALKACAVAESAPWAFGE